MSNLRLKKRILKQANDKDDLFNSGKYDEILDLLFLNSEDSEPKEKKEEEMNNNSLWFDGFEKPKNSVWEQEPIDLDASEQQYRLDFNSITKEKQNVPNEREAGEEQISVEVYGYMDLEKLLSLDGKAGEKREWTTDANGRKWFGNYTEEQWNTLLNHMKENGLYWGIIVEVLSNGLATIYEGNHRVQAAKQLGWSEVPVHVVYRGHSQKFFRFK